MNLMKKLLALVLMIAAPIISGKAFYEYVQVKHLQHKPNYPFGKELMKQIRVSDISYLADYQSQLLTIGMVFLAISVLAYLSMMIRALINLVWLAVIIAIGYYLQTVM